MYLKCCKTDDTEPKSSAVVTVLFYQDIYNNITACHKAFRDRHRFKMFATLYNKYMAEIICLFYYEKL